MHTLRDGPLENLWGGRAKYKKKISPKGTSNEKNSCYGLRKSYKKFDNEKFLRVENSPNLSLHQITFLMVRPMKRDVEGALKTSVWREDWLQMS